MTPTNSRCPLCGGEPHLHEHEYYLRNEDGEYVQYMQYRVYCQRCGLHACPHWRDAAQAYLEWDALVKRILEKVEEGVSDAKKASYAATQFQDRLRFLFRTANILCACSKWPKRSDEEVEDLVTSVSSYLKWHAGEVKQADAKGPSLDKLKTIFPGGAVPLYIRLEKDLAEMAHDFLEETAPDASGELDHWKMRKACTTLLSAAERFRRQSHDAMRMFSSEHIDIGAFGPIVRRHKEGGDKCCETASS